jgi:aminoglycoside 3-N-acetyltransferase
VRRLRRVLGPAGPQLRWIECLDDNDGIVPCEVEDYFKLILEDFLATGRAATGLVGNARSELIDAQMLVDFAVRWLVDRFA